MSVEAKRARKAMLADLRSVVSLCTCEWPLTRYRNGHGHHPECPAAGAERHPQQPPASARGAS